MLTISRQILLDNGVRRRAQSPHDRTNERKPSISVVNFDIQSTKSDALSFSHLRTTARDFSKVFCVQSSLERVFVTLAARDGLNVLRNANVKEYVTALLSAFRKAEQRFLSAV